MSSWGQGARPVDELTPNLNGLAVVHLVMRYSPGKSRLEVSP